MCEPLMPLVTGWNAVNVCIIAANVSSCLLMLPLHHCQVSSAAGRDKALLEAKASKMKAKLDDALSKSAAIETAPLPKIEVWCSCSCCPDSLFRVCRRIACLMQSNALRHAT